MGDQERRSLLIAHCSLRTAHCSLLAAAAVYYPFSAHFQLGKIAIESTLGSFPPLFLTSRQS
jgi:hypothetical protein